MKPFYETKFFRHFLPFMILVIGGSFFVKEFTKLRYKYRKTVSYDLRAEVKAHGIEMKKPATLEEEYEKIRAMNIDNWENVRIPRPWGESDDTSSS